MFMLHFQMICIQIKNFSSVVNHYYWITEITKILIYFTSFQKDQFVISNDSIVIYACLSNTVIYKFFLIHPN